MAKPKIVVRVADDNQWEWVRKAGNGHIVATSQVHFESAQHAIDNANSENNFEYEVVVEEPEVTIATPISPVEMDQSSASDYGTVEPVDSSDL